MRPAAASRPGSAVYRTPILCDHAALLHEPTTAKASITLAEIQDELRERGIRVGSLSTIWAMLRKADARMQDALCTTISDLLDRFSPTECRNDLAHSGQAFE